MGTGSIFEFPSQLQNEARYILSPCADYQLEKTHHRSSQKSLRWMRSGLHIPEPLVDDDIDYVLFPHLHIPLAEESGAKLRSLPGVQYLQGNIEFKTITTTCTKTL